METVTSPLPFFFKLVVFCFLVLIGILAVKDFLISIKLFKTLLYIILLVGLFAILVLIFSFFKP